MDKDSAWLLRGALFVVYFWFGALKLLGLSPATELVHHLFDITVPLLSFGTFFYLFATFEVLLGVSFLFPRLIRLSFFLTLLHVFCTVMPLFLLPHEAWEHFLVPTLEGQYMIKNVLIIAAVFALYRHRDGRKHA